jgi:HEPN domain-containing protein/predicted nucleotidyltransferase
MNKAVKDITERIIQGYDPERIILFGSHGTKHQGKNSDVDLLIIKETGKRLIDRRVEVEKILSDRSLPIDIMVYTPQEIKYLYSIGSPFVEEVMEKGRLLYMRKATRAWINDVEEELDSALILYEHGKYRGACYHSQQCVEKGLKTLILEKGTRPERIHDILELLKKTRSLGHNIPLSIDDAIFLNSIYKGRYSTEEGLLPHGEPLQTDAEKAILSAKALMTFIREHITDAD